MVVEPGHGDAGGVGELTHADGAVPRSEKRRSAVSTMRSRVPAGALALVAAPVTRSWSHLLERSFKFAGTGPASGYGVGVVRDGQVIPPIERRAQAVSRVTIHFPPTLTALPGRFGYSGWPSCRTV